MTKNNKKKTTGQNVIAFIEKYCVVPEGDDIGKPVVLDKFQKAFILAVYDNPHVTDTAILSMARKNGKTALIALLVLAHLVGPVAVQNSRIISGAQSKEQAAEVYNYASKCVQLSAKLSAMVRVIPSSKKLVGIMMNVEYQAVSADKKTAHGKSPIVAIIDEAGQVEGPRSDFIDAIVTAQGAYSNPLLIYISTQAANDSDFFSIIIDDAQNNKPPKTICHVYAADENADILDEKQWYKANPALGKFRSMSDMRKLAEAASRMPSAGNTFRNLNLNQRISTNAPIFSKDAWVACNEKFTVTPDMCEELYGGLDLSGRTDLTGFILYGLYKGKWYCWCWCWTPEKGLHERAKRDRAPYDLWVQQGFMLTTPGATVDYEFVAYELVKNICPGLNITGIAFDRWRIQFLRKEIERLGAELPLVEWGQGFKDMGPAIDAIEDKVLNHSLRHGGHPVLNMCMAHSVVTKDPAGNRKLDKAKRSGRIDLMVALTMAAGLAERNEILEGKLQDFIESPLIL